MNAVPKHRGVLGHRFGLEPVNLPDAVAREGKTLPPVRILLELKHHSRNLRRNPAESGVEFAPAFLGQPLLRDVAGHGEKTGDVAAPIAHRRHGDAHRYASTVLTEV